MNNAATVAAFDVDHTITRHDCVGRFLVRLGGRRGIAGALARQPVRSITAAIRRDRDELKEIVVGGILTGRYVDDVDREGRSFAAEMLAGDLRADVVARLRWHLRAGHRVVLVSASLGSYLRPFAELLGVDDVLCSDVAVDAGRYLDRLDGPNCRGAEKVVRLSAWLAERGLATDDLWCYGDSAGDAPMLAMSPRPVWVTGARLPVAPNLVDRVSRALLREARPKQWAKNLLVFAAPGAAHVLGQADALAKTIALFVAFCLVSSGTYFWNDLLDIELDRLHPTKRFRPIASGAIPVGTARLVGTLGIVVGLAMAFAVRWQAGAVVAGYVALTLTYSLIWKHHAVLDLIAVAGGFVLRAIAGAVGVDVPMSTWFVLFTSFASLFIVTGKRYAELREHGEDAAQSRATLDAYSLGYLRIVLSVSLGAAILTYCDWAFETTQDLGTRYPFYELSIVPMLAALLRYTLVLEQGHGAAPEEIFLSDRMLQLLGVIWLAVFGLGVYVR